MKNNERNSSVEVLRIIFAIGVIVLHYNNGGGGLNSVIPGSINEKYIVLSEALSISAVNIFILISGYYLCSKNRCRTIKVFALLLQTGVFRAIFFFLDHIINDTVISVADCVVAFLPINYFVVLYCTLYLLSPYINFGLQRMSKATLRKLAWLMFVLFSIETIIVDYLNIIGSHSFDMMSTVSAAGSQGGYTIINFIMVYTIGAALRLLEIRINKHICCVGIMFGIIALWAIIFYEKTNTLPLTALNYNNPIIIVLAVLILGLAVQKKFNSNTINEMARASFTCFLFHSWFLQYVDIEKACNGPVLKLISSQIITVVILFLGSYVAYKIWSYIWYVLKTLTKSEKLFHKLDEILYGGLSCGIGEKQQSNMPTSMN